MSRLIADVPATSARCASTVSWIPVVGSSLTTSWFGSGGATRSLKPRFGACLKTSRSSVWVAWQALPGPDEERHAGPAPVLDLQPKRRVGLGRRARIDAVDVEIAVVLPAHVVRRVGVGDGVEERDQGVLDHRRVTPRRHLHRGGRHDLHQVVDDDVAERADRIVEVAAILDAEALGHGDLRPTRCGSGSRSARASSSRTGDGGSPRDPSFRGSGRSGRAATRRCTGAARRPARRPIPRSWPNGFSTTTRPVSVRPASASPLTTAPNRKGGISR